MKEEEEKAFCGLRLFEKATESLLKGVCHNLREIGKRYEEYCSSNTKILSSGALSVSFDLVIAFFSVVFLTFTQRFQRKYEGLQPHGVPLSRQRHKDEDQNSILPWPGRQTPRGGLAENYLKGQNLSRVLSLSLSPKVSM